MRERTVLLIEDNEHERRIFSRYLEFVGCRALTAADGRQGLRMAREALPDMVFLDLGLPELDGWEVMRRMQADLALRWMPVIALTAREVERREWEDAGFCGYLAKPVAPFRVLEEMERCLGSPHRTDLARSSQLTAVAPGGDARNGSRSELLRELIGGPRDRRSRSEGGISGRRTPR